MAPPSGPAARACIAAFLLLLTALPATRALAGDATITIDPATRYQVISGWEATATIGEPDAPTLPLYADDVFDQAVDDLGINRLRVEVRAGAENPVDYWTQRYVTGQINQAEWTSLRYSTVNDNADASVTNAAGFQWSELDWNMATIAIPMKERLEARGEQLFINVDYVAFTSQIGSGLAYLHDDPDEYAEFVLAAVEHLDQTFGVVPDAWEVILEPDLVSQWDGTTIGNAIVASKARLQAAGYDVPFIASSGSCITNAISYFDDLAAVPGAADALTEISYHRYCGASTTQLQQIATRADTWGIGSAMLEHGGSTRENLHDDLEIANNVAWQQFTLAFHGTNDTGFKYYLVDETDPQNPIVTLGEDGGYFRQYFRFVRRGAQRIGASSTGPDQEPLGWENANGTTVVTVLSSASGTLTFDNLPPATYGISYTDHWAVGMELGQVTISQPGQPLQATMPGQGVITVYDVGYLPEPDAPLLAGTALTVLAGLRRRSRAGRASRYSRS